MTNKTTTKILGIDIGGTKTLFGLFEGDGQLLKTFKFETPASYEEFIELITTEVRVFIAGHTISACVAAVPGKLDRTRGIGIAFGNRPWENVPIGADLTKAVGIPVHIENDANLAGLSEALLIPKYPKVLYLTVSTGIGSAYVVNGRLDKSMLDAEVGHMMLEHEGRLRTWESFASGKAVYARLGKKVSEITDSGDWYMLARNIAIGLINVIATTTPDAIVIGGGAGSNLEKFLPRLEEELILYQTNVVDIPPIFKAKNPEEAVIYGCYALATQS
jgi:predicted NBD/HSP70 family sugar kinase